MGNDAAIGFWSYTHEDNTLDEGSIIQLSRLLMEEYNLLSGETLDLFVDRNDLAWGQEWRKRIDTSIAETTFFIPIITPRYFKRPECRRELLEFAAKAELLGADELLMPILYIEVPDLSSENPDEAIALVARMQYADWRQNRWLEVQSREYRRGVNALAQRLLSITRKVTEQQLKRELDSDPEDDGADGINDVVERIEALLSDWLDAVIGEKSVGAQVTAIWEHYLLQESKLKGRNAPAQAILSARIRMAREMLPLARRGQQDGQLYLSRSIELDPLISALIRLVAEHPESFPLAVPVREAIDEAMEAIRLQDQYVTMRSKGEDFESVQDVLRRMNHLGRIFQQCNTAFMAKQRNAKEGNEIIRRWNAELVDHRSSNSTDKEQAEGESSKDPANEKDKK